jgi:hypothetical protein
MLMISVVSLNCLIGSQLRWLFYFSIACPRLGSEGIFMARYEIAAAVISSRESPETLWRTLRRTVDEIEASSGIVDVIVNGKRELADCLIRLMKQDSRLGSHRVVARCWFLACGDKAHAWNTYVHELWPDAATTVILDGYVEVARGAFKGIASALDEKAGTLAATGVPSVGRSARRLGEEMKADGGIHGNLFGLSKEAVVRIRSERFRLPVGIYRVDAMIGAAIFKEFKASGSRWDSSRVAVLPEVTWWFDTLKWWRPDDIRTHLRRMSRQYQGRLENLAFRDFFIRRQLPLGRLPRTALELIEDWIIQAPAEAKATLGRFSPRAYALKRLREARDWSCVDAPPLLLFDSSRPLKL